MPRSDIDVLRMPESMPWHYSQAVKVGNTVYVAGQVATKDGALIGQDDIEVQARQAYTNVVEVLAKAGATMDDVVRETVYLADRSQLPQVAKVREGFYSERYPASTAVFSGAGDGYSIEVEVTAVIGE